MRYDDAYEKTEQDKPTFKIERRILSALRKTPLSLCLSAVLIGAAAFAWYLAQQSVPTP